MISKHWGGVAAYGLPGIAVGLALAWWGGGHGPTARAQAAVPAADLNGTIAFTSTSNGSSAQMLYLIDTKQKSFAVYRVDPAGSKAGGAVKLEAARKYQFDLQLNEFNNQQPEVSAVEGMVQAMAKSKQ